MGFENGCPLRMAGLCFKHGGGKSVNGFRLFSVRSDLCLNMALEKSLELPADGASVKF